MKCRARELGGCAGRQSGEHIISRCLGTGRFVTVKGLPFCRSEPKAISWASATSNILCEKHNSELSPLDSEAGRFKDSMFRCLTDTNILATKGLYRGPESIELSGNRFSRWIAKTYCNMLTVGKREPGPGFVAYSFDRPTKRRFHTYVSAVVGRLYPFDFDNIELGDFFDETGGIVVYVYFYSLLWFVSNVNLKNKQWVILEGRDTVIASSSLLEAPRTICFQVPLGSDLSAVQYALSIDWRR